MCRAISRRHVVTRVTNNETVSEENTIDATHKNVTQFSLDILKVATLSKLSF